MTTENPGTPTLITISSVVPETAPAGKLLITARWKSTDKKTVSAANAKRCVELESNIWQELSANGADKTLVLFMHDAVEDLARKYLSTIVEDSNWMRTQVPAADFTLATLLAWNAEQAATSGRLNGEEIAAWIATSATVKMVTEKHGAPVGKALGDQFVKLAGPNHGLTTEKAASLLSKLWQQEDGDSTTGLRVLLRLTSISKKQSTEDVLGSIL